MSEKLNPQQQHAVNLFIAGGMKSQRGAMIGAGYSKAYANKAGKYLFSKKIVQDIIEDHLTKAAQETQSELIDIIKDLSTMNSIDVPSLFVPDEDWEGHFRFKHPHELTPAERKSIKKISEKKIDIFEHGVDEDTQKSYKKYIKTIQRFTYETYDKYTALDMMAKIQGLFIKAQDPEVEDSGVIAERNRMATIPTNELKKQLDAINAMLENKADKERDRNAISVEFKEVKK